MFKSLGTDPQIISNTCDLKDGKEGLSQVKRVRKNSSDKRSKTCWWVEEIKAGIQSEMWARKAEVRACRT